MALLFIALLCYHAYHSQVCSLTCLYQMKSKALRLAARIVRSQRSCKREFSCLLTLQILLLSPPLCAG